MGLSLEYVCVGIIFLAIPELQNTLHYMVWFLLHFVMLFSMFAIKLTLIWHTKCDRDRLQSEFAAFLLLFWAVHNLASYSSLSLKLKNVNFPLGRLGKAHKEKEKEKEKDDKRSNVDAGSKHKSSERERDRGKDEMKRKHRGSSPERWLSMKMDPWCFSAIQYNLPNVVAILFSFIQYINSTFIF